MLKALETDGLQHLHDPLLDFSLRQLLHPQAESNIFKYIQVREQGVFLENRIDLPLIGRNVINPHAIEQDVSRCRHRETSDNTQRGGFSAPAGSEKREELLIIDVQIDVIENLLVVESHAEIPQANQLFGHVSSPISIDRFHFIFSTAARKIPPLLSVKGGPCFFEIRHFRMI